MTQNDKLIIAISRLNGEFMGTISGVLSWDIPQELKDVLKAKYEALSKIDYLKEYKFSAELNEK